jgi:predicted ester cyclase
MGISTTGNSINIHGMVLSRFREGKIIEEWEVLDQLTLLQQLGVVALPK